MFARVKGILSFLFYVGIFSFLPFYSSKFLSGKYKIILPPNLLLTFAILGFLLGIFSLIKNWTKRTSLLNLVSLLTLDFLGLYLFLYAAGLGKVENFGKVEKLLRIGSQEIGFSLDLRFFVYLVIAITVAKIIDNCLDFFLARKVKS